jgi:hypothetical protein
LPIRCGGKKDPRPPRIKNVRIVMALAAVSGSLSAEMNGTLILIELAGHVGLLLWGTHMVGTGVQRGFGRTLRQWLGRNLDSRLHAFGTGLGITALLQSSTATGLLVSTSHFSVTSSYSEINIITL